MHCVTIVKRMDDDDHEPLLYSWTTFNRVCSRQQFNTKVVACPGVRETGVKCEGTNGSTGKYIDLP